MLLAVLDSNYRLTLYRKAPASAPTSVCPRYVRGTVGTYPFNGPSTLCHPHSSRYYRSHCRQLGICSFSQLITVNGLPFFRYLLESMPCGRQPVTSPGRDGFPGRLAVLSYTMCGICATLVLLTCPVGRSSRLVIGSQALLHLPITSSRLYHLPLVVGSSHVAVHTAFRLVFLACVQP